MLTRPIPSSGEALPVVGVGTWQTFDIGNSRAELDPRKEVLRILFEAGGKVVDSSPMYGRAEAVAGTLLGEMKARDKAFVATKVWTSGEAAGIREMQASSAKMQAPVIDLMQIHNLLDWKVHLKTLRKWKDEGRIRYIGITHYTDAALDDLTAILRSEKIDFVQFAFSIGQRAAQQRLLPVVAERGAATLINRPLGSGGLFGKTKGRALPGIAAEIGASSWAQFFLKYLLGHPEVTCVIPGTGKPEHARDNVDAGVGVMPDAVQRRKMVEAWEKG